MHSKHQFTMNQTEKQDTLKDIVNRESAASEEVKQNDIAALRAKIDTDRREIERLKDLNRKKKRTIIVLSVFLGLFAAVIAAMLINFLTYTGTNPNENTSTQTESVSQTPQSTDPVLDKANNNDPQAQLSVALRYFSGTDGFTQDKQQAVEWFIRSANNGNTKAMLLLGDCYTQGDGTEKDTRNAFKYYFMAARQDDKEGLYKVGKAYYYGTAVDKNTEKALFYLNKSASQGYDPAAKLIEIIKQDVSVQPSSTQNQTSSASAGTESTTTKQ